MELNFSELISNFATTNILGLDLGFLLFLVIHLVLSLVYYIVVCAKIGNNTQSFSEGVIVLLMPIFGLIFLVAVRLAKTSGEREVVDTYHQHALDQLILGEHAQHDSNILPLNDVLMMDDNSQKRILLTDAIKQNVLSNQEVLRKAIKDDDREVSHYAVSLVTVSIEAIEKKLFDLEKELQRKPTDKELLSEYVKNMSEYLGMGFLDDRSREKSEQSYADALEKLLEVAKDDPSIFATKINYEISFGNFAKAEEYCQKFLRQFPTSEEPFLMYIKLYQQTRQYEKFHEKISELKKCPIQLSANALGMIRFWEQAN